MSPAQILDPFVERRPAVVLVRAALERLLRPERLDQIFEDVARRQYTKQLLFSQIVALMTAVATRTHASVHAAYFAMQDRLQVSPAALYDKLNRLELGIAHAMIRETAADASTVIDSMPASKKEILPGLEVYYSTAIIRHRWSTAWRSFAVRAKGRCWDSRWLSWTLNGG